MATVNGSGSTWSSLHGQGHPPAQGPVDLYVGYSGNGTLNITNGGNVSFGGLAAGGYISGYIGYNSGSTGTVRVDGSGSMLGSANRLFAPILSVGFSGNGTLIITNGGAVGNSDGYIGNNAGSTGTATVDGAGSTWTNNGSLFVGKSGNGSLDHERRRRDLSARNG